MSKLEVQSFKRFIEVILEAESNTDQWRAKLFYQSIQQMSNAFFQGNDVTDKVISLENVIHFIEVYHSQELGDKQQKTLMKYFNFHNKCTQQKAQFFEKLNKPINNKLIIDMDNNLKQSELKSCLLQIFKSIIQGFDKISQERQNCSLKSTQIIKFFLTQYKVKTLNKQSLKEFMYQNEIYNRVNYNYLKEYIFGNKEQVQWETLFKNSHILNKNIEIQQIQQLSQQYLISQKYVNNQAKSLNPKFQSNKSIIKHQNVEQYDKKQSQTMTKKSIQLQEKDQKDELFTKTLSQIDQIEQMLSKTKQKYRDSQQQLQLEKQQTKKQQILTSFNKRPIFDYSKFKIEKSNSSLKLQEKCGQNHKQKEFGKNEQKILESRVRPYISRSKQNQDFNSQNVSVQSISTTKINTFSNQNIDYPEKRKIGTIKRRSISKENLAKPQSLMNSNDSSLNLRFKKNDYTEYQAVLKQIKKEENSYSKLLEQREKFLEYRNLKKELRLNRKASEPHSVNYLKSDHTRIGSHYLMDSYHKRIQPFDCRQLNRIQSTALKIKTEINEQRPLSFYKYSSSNSKQNSISEIKTDLSKSRVSSKKRDQIVQKATSQARLKIQQIQNRALGKLSKLDSFGKQTDRRKSSHHYKQSYENIDSSNYKVINTVNQPIVNQNKFSSNISPNVGRIQQTGKVNSPKNDFLVNHLMTKRPGGLRLNSQGVGTRNL